MKVFSGRGVFTMYINQYGNPDDPVIILLAPMMVSGADLYELMYPYFTKSYYVISPDQGGHGNAGAYISADDEYAALKEFLLDNNIRDIDLVYGASLGVAVSYRLFLDKTFNVKHAFFDGVALTKSAGLAEWFMKKLFRSRKKKLSKTHAEASKSLVKVYGYDFAKMMTKNFERITLEDIDAICYACCHYDLRKLTDAEQRKLHLDFGQMDPDYKYSKKTIPLYMPNADVVIRDGYTHCSYMAAHPKEYVEQIESFIRL